MVKNKTGGNKAKKQGRKHISVPQNRNTRFAKEDGEMYAVITKIHGGPNCEAICNDGITRMCVIRNKFRGRDKKDNTITSNCWVLIGIRDWEVVAKGKLEKCDLLEVYNNTEKEKIINTLNKNELINIINIGEENSEINKSCTGFIITDIEPEVEDDIHENNIPIDKDNDKDKHIEDDNDTDDFIDVDEI
jgi:initiation factor 1A|tara:strand:- start:1030 stop:1599 length:570 start_codon:yes stop_codon:yes gene_type:complete